MKKLMALLKSFGYAGRGVAAAVMRERNMRIHLCAVAFVVICGLWQGLSPTHWAVELALCGAVIALELFNTALEALCDEVCPERRDGIRQCKDTAAGGVLVLAAVSATIWTLLLVTGPGYLDQFLERFQLPVALVWAAAGIAFVFLLKYPQNRREE